jgi:hypothetical protein
MKNAVDQRVDIMFSPSYDGRTSGNAITNCNEKKAYGVAGWISMAQDMVSGWLL